MVKLLERTKHNTSSVHSVASNQSEFLSFTRPLEAIATDHYGYRRGIITAQIALETGNGRRVIDRNLFNIKCTQSWLTAGGGCVDVKTSEYKGGVKVSQVASFRKYNSYTDSLIDYIDLISGNARYAYAWANRDNPAEYFNGLVLGGYATDPQYTASLLQRYNAVKGLV